MKLISFVLCGLLVLSVGCGSNNQSGFNEDSSNALRSDKLTVKESWRIRCESGMPY